MSSKSIEYYLVDIKKVNIPDKGLGEYIGGFSEQNKPFNWLNLCWNLLPVIGQVFFLLHLLLHWWIKTHPRRILLYKNGFISQTLDGKGRVRKENVINFHETNGILCSKTQQYLNLYGIRIYNGTAVCLYASTNKNAKQLILKGLYRNKKEVEGKYNFIGYACNAISKAWGKFGVKQLNNELNTKGYVSFVTSTGEVLVGPDFIKVNGVVVNSGFKYSFACGYLLLYPNDAENLQYKQQRKPIQINLSEIYNQELFLMTISQLLGIR